MKKAEALGEGLLTVYRLFLVAVVALIVLGISSVFYDYYIDVKDVEAFVVGRNLAECLSEEFVTLDFEEDLGEYCDLNLEDVYVKIEFNSPEELKVLESGDSGIEWVKNANIEKKYRLGRFVEVYPLMVNFSENIVRADSKVEVLVQHEF